MLHQISKRVALSVLLVGLVVTVPFVALAQDKPQFDNPLGDATFAGIIVTVTRFLLGLAGFLAMAALVWGGVLYILSLGNDNYVQQAKKVIFWAIIGLVVIILSFVIISTVGQFLGVSSD